MKIIRLATLIALPVSAVGLTAGISYGLSSGTTNTPPSTPDTSVQKGTTLRTLPNSSSPYARHAVTNQASIVAQLDQDGLKISVDGTSLSNIAIVQGIETLEQNSIANGQSSSAVAQPSSIALLERESIAVKVFDQLVYSYANANGMAESYSQAQNAAQQNYALWLKDGSPEVVLPNGLSGSDAFTSPSAIATLQEVDSIQNAENALAGPAHKPDGSTNNRSETLKAWMAHDLSTHTVDISGTPSPLSAASLPGYLPSQM